MIFYFHIWKRGSVRVYFLFFDSNELNFLKTLLSSPLPVFGYYLCHHTSQASWDKSSSPSRKVRFYTLLRAGTGITAIRDDLFLCWTRGWKKKTLLMGILSKKTDVSHIITVGFATCSTASNCKEHPPAPRGFVMDWLSRNEGRAVLHFFIEEVLFSLYLSWIPFWWRTVIRADGKICRDAVEQQAD